MRIRLLVVSIIGTLVAATAAPAAPDINWVGSVGLGAGYLSLKTTDPAIRPLEDVQARESAGGVVTFDNAYLHWGIDYGITAVQLKENPDLDYLDHQVNMELSLDRWLQRYTQDGRLVVTATGRLSPSLPPLDQTVTPTAGTAPAGDGTAGVPTAERVARDDLLNIEDNPNGYVLIYGLRFSDEPDPFRRYEVGWLVTDNRFDSSVVADIATLTLTGEYAVRSSGGEIGVGFRHRRLLRRPEPAEVHGLSLFTTNANRRLTWRLEPGVGYRGDRQDYFATFLATGEVVLPRVAYSAGYGTNVELATVGQTVVDRNHRVFVAAETTRNRRFPRMVTASTWLAKFARRVEATFAQTIRFRPGVDGVLSYSRTGLWWESATTGDKFRRTSDVVAFNLRWSFP